MNRSRTAPVLAAALTFAAMGLVITSVSPSYDFFMYYFTLVVTPMTMLCGVFFPSDQLPGAFQAVGAVLPLSHATGLVRPLLLGTVPDNIPLHVAVLVIYAIVGYLVALRLLKRRLSR